MLDTLPDDFEMMQDAIGLALENFAKNVPDIPSPFHPQVYRRQRFIDSDVEDKQETTTADPVATDLKRTNVVEIHIPTWQQFGYSGNDGTQFKFTYLITHELEVVDKWGDSGSGLRFLNSSQLATAYGLKLAELLTKNNPDGTSNVNLGYQNCNHEYMEMISAVIFETDDETGGSLHSMLYQIVVNATNIIASP